MTIDCKQALLMMISGAESLIRVYKANGEEQYVEHRQFIADTYQEIHDCIVKLEAELAEAKDELFTLATRVLTDDWTKREWSKWAKAKAKETKNDKQA